MVKILGVICVLVSCAGFGFLKSTELSKELEEAEELKKIFLMLHSEIKYMRAPLAEAFYHIGEKASPIYKEWLFTLYRHLEKKEKAEFQTVWNQAIEQNLTKLHIKKEVLYDLKKMGRNLESYDYEMELGMIELFVEQLNILTKNKQETLAEKKRLYQYLGVISGIVVAVILV